jgi:hypothetical protein
MAGWRQAIELALSEEDVNRLGVVARREVKLIKETAAAAKQEPSDAVAIVYDVKPARPIRVTSASRSRRPSTKFYKL